MLMLRVTDYLKLMHDITLVLCLQLGKQLGESLAVQRLSSSTPIIDMQF